jgi:glyoxylase-like metal-dependent hydrolase (beta-lactamase superfamily II)
METRLPDGQANAPEPRKGAAGPDYPALDIPAPGEAVQVAEGVLWLRFSLPMALDHVNVWAIRDGEGWVIVDTGLGLPDTIDAWETALAGPLEGRPVTRLICTHMHPDHIGLAGWLCERSGAPLFMSRLEYVTGRMLLADTGPAPESGAAFYRAAGWSDEQIEGYRTRYGMFGKAVRPMPPEFTRLSDGDGIEIDGDAWRIIVGTGHSPEHVCLLRERDDLFISGDQLLPRISSNISVWPTEPQSDPLKDWLDSLEALKGRIPESALVLPSHGEPFRGAHARLEALLRGHDVALRRLERTLAEPKRAVDVFPSLFGRAVGEGVLGMATGEAIAHLNYLEAQGRIGRDRDADGVDWWTRIETGEPA